MRKKCVHVLMNANMSAQISGRKNKNPCKNHANLSAQKNKIRAKIMRI